MPKNPLLQLKPAAVKEKKRNKKKSPVSPLKKIQSPLKNKLLNSPAKTLPGACGSPQKFIDGFLKYEGPASEKPLVKFFSIFSTLTFYQILMYLILCKYCTFSSFVFLQGEPSASTSGAPGLPGLQPVPPDCARPPAPNLAGAVEFSDVKTLLKEWITTISGWLGWW